MTKFNKYTVVTEDNLKEITDGKMTVHYVEPDTLFSEPRFLAIDIAREMSVAADTTRKDECNEGQL